RAPLLAYPTLFRPAAAVGTAGTAEHARDRACRVDRTRNPGRYDQPVGLVLLRESCWFLCIVCDTCRSVSQWPRNGAPDASVAPVGDRVHPANRRGTVLCEREL